MALLVLLTLALPTACSDWNDIEPVNIDPQHPKDQNPELWARYMESLRVYKQERPHYITYGSFNNGAEQSKNEGAYLRSLPDSLDIVTLANPENITSYDREDIPTLQEKSTRVLYLVDYAAKMTDLTDATALGSWLDKAVATANELHLDGFAFNGLPLYAGTDAEQAARKEAARLIVSKLSAVNKMLVFEGDPAFVNTNDLDKLDYVVMNTAGIESAVSLKIYVANVISTYALPKEKLLLAAKMGTKIVDEENVKQDAVTDMIGRVVSLGPLGGLAIYALGDDYYQTSMNYQSCRTAIQKMNPSK
jgi:hypothetical protein bacD2_12506